MDSLGGCGMTLAGHSDVRGEMVMHFSGRDSRVLEGGWLPGIRPPVRSIRLAMPAPPTDPDRRRSSVIINDTTSYRYLTSFIDA